MDATDFLSKASYLALPMPSRPKVYLCIANGTVSKRSFELYNPFSLKGKIVKRLAQFLCVYCNSIARKLLPITKGEKSEFIEFLENSLSRSVVSSVYIATANDKIVLQLQDDSKVFGYLKYPISPLGEKRLINERKAINILSKESVVPELIQQGTFDNRPFIIVKDLKGTIGPLNDTTYEIVLTRLRKDRKYKLVDHPRIVQLKPLLDAFDESNLAQVLRKAVQLSHHEYFEVFEHGDFAPWNLIQTAGDIIPFDLEYFEENGLEYLDEIKYHFQVQHLLNGKEGRSLVDAVLRKLNFNEATILFRIFLLKEITNKLGTDESYEFEQSLLHIISEEKSPLNK